MKKTFFLFIGLALFSNYALAHKESFIKSNHLEIKHSGGTNSAGCHNEKWGGYHCH